MKLKTYHAYSMAEALAAVKRDLGADAVILHTRTFKRGGLFGLWRKTVVEVTATPARAQASPQPTAPAPKVRLKSLQARAAYASGLASAANSGTSDNRNQPASLEQDRERTRRLAMALQEQHRRGASQPTTFATSEPPPKLQVAKRNPAATAPAAPVERTARRFVLTSPDRLLEAKPKSETRKRSPGGSSPKSPVSPDGLRETEPAAGVGATHVNAMHDELSAIRQMVGQVLQRQAAPKSPETDLPQHLFEMYLKLVSQDISDELADEIVRSVRQEIGEDELENETAIRSAVLKRLASYIPVAGEAATLQSPDHRPLTIALVGPTGVGKTTTLAKLAAKFKLQHGKSVGLITADTYRIAAVDQLRTYADIIGLPLQVALTPAEMKHAVAGMQDCDVILIDTAGRSQKDAGRIAELKRFIEAANPHEVHMVLSSTASEQVLLAEAQAFSAVGVHKIMLTKLDEAVSFGMLINVIRRVGKQLSFMTTGQEVPDHIEVGRADRLAELVMGEPLHREARLVRCGAAMGAVTNFEASPAMEKVLV